MKAPSLRCSMFVRDAAKAPLSIRSEGAMFAAKPRARRASPRCAHRAQAPRPTQHRGDLRAKDRRRFRTTRPATPSRVRALHRASAREGSATHPRLATMQRPTRALLHQGFRRVFVFLPRAFSPSLARARRPGTPAPSPRRRRSPSSPRARCECASAGAFPPRSSRAPRCA